MIDPKWIDRDSFLIPHALWRDASNDGVLTTAIGGLLGVLNPDHVDSALMACITPSGLLMRRPDNSRPNQSHDGWMSLATWCLYRKNVKLARRLLVSGLIRLGYMKNTKFEFGGKTLWQKLNTVLEPWMGRFPKIWVTLLATAFPNAFVRWCCSAIILMTQFFTSVNLEDASGLQLSWINLYAVKLMGNPSPMSTFLAEIRNKGTSIADVLAPTMYDSDNPVIEGYREFERGLG